MMVSDLFDIITHAAILVTAYFYRTMDFLPKLSGCKIASIPYRRCETVIQKACYYP